MLSIADPQPIDTCLGDCICYIKYNIKRLLVAFGFSYKGDSFCDFLFGYSANQASSEKGSTKKGETLLPRAANAFRL